MPRMFDMFRDKNNDANKGKQKNKLSYDDLAKTKAEPSKDAPLVFPNDDLAKTKAEPSKDAPLIFPKWALQSIARKAKDTNYYSSISKKLILDFTKDESSNPEEANKIYGNGVALVINILESAKKSEDLNKITNELNDLLDRIFNKIIMGNDLLHTIYNNDQTDFYLPHHIINSVILSCTIGYGMGFNKSRLAYLGIACLFYDIGLIYQDDIINKNRIFNAEERNIVKNHVFKTLEIIKDVKIINDSIKKTILMHHERSNGKGYPNNLSDDKIDTYAKIIGLVDTYEALTHIRVYRNKIDPHSAVKAILTSLKDYFSLDILKVFINQMSVYPIGSIVRLDGGETAKVIGVQSGSSLRPIIKIIQDANGENIDNGIITDLSKQDYPFIKNSM